MSICSLLVYTNTSDFLNMYLVPCDLAELIYWVQDVFIDCFGDFLCQTIMSSTNIGSFISFFFNLNELWQILFLEELFHFFFVVKFLCLEVFLVFSYSFMFAESAEIYCFISGISNFIFFFLCVSLARSLSILSIFSKYQVFVSLSFLIVFLVFTQFYYFFLSGHFLFILLLLRFLT